MPADRMTSEPTRTVVVVDDERAVADAVGRYLEACGWAVQVLEDPNEGLASVTEDPPFALLVDLAMPGLDGASLARRVRERLGSRSPRVVFISAHDPTPRDEALADATFRKPFRVSAIERVLAGWAREDDDPERSGTRARAGALVELAKYRRDSGR